MLYRGKIACVDIILAFAFGFLVIILYHLALFEMKRRRMMIFETGEQLITPITYQWCLTSLPIKLSYTFYWLQQTLQLFELTFPISVGVLWLLWCLVLYIENVILALHFNPWVREIHLAPNICPRCYRVYYILVDDLCVQFRWRLLFLRIIIWNNFHIGIILLFLGPVSIEIS